jgi:hypothetical protein
VRQCSLAVWRRTEAVRRLPGESYRPLLSFPDPAPIKVNTRSMLLWPRFARFGGIWKTSGGILEVERARSTVDGRIAVGWTWNGARAAGRLSVRLDWSIFTVRLVRTRRTGSLNFLGLC